MDNTPVTPKYSAKNGANRILRALLAAKAAEPSEFEQIVGRFILVLLMTAYAAFSYAFDELEGGPIQIVLITVAAAWALSLSFLTHYGLRPTHRSRRRIASILADAAILSLLLGVGGEPAVILFPAYLWTVLYSGFRYGLSYLYGAVAANLLGFLVMASLTPFWRDAWQFSAGLALAILFIPLYAAKLIQNLHDARTAAEAVSEAKTEFLSMVSHELRTPISAIIGLAHVSKITATSPTERFSAISTELAASRLLRMVDTILKFQRVESGVIECNKEAFDPLDVLNEVYAIVEPLVRQKQLDFHLLFRSGLPDTIITDPDHLQTIILNLATNAIKYTQEGSVTLAIGISGGPNATKLRVTVRDTGIGIVPEVQPRIFNRFIRADDKDVKAETGIGLGLATCKSLTGLLGGKIGFESSYGKGSLFWVELPVDRPDMDEIAWKDGGAVTPIFIGTASDFSGLADWTAARTITQDEAIRRITRQPDDGAASLFVVASYPLSQGLHQAFRERHERQAPSPALIVIGKELGLPGALETSFMGVSAKAASPDEVAGLISTVGRWVWRISQNFVSKKPELTAPGRSMTVLIADDNDLNCQVLCRMLTLMGHQPILASRGDEALRMLREGVADVALLDINMPAMSGIDVCRAYKASLGDGNPIPLIAFTANASNAMRRECFEAGMTEVLSKPVTSQDLSDAFNKCGLQSAAPHKESLNHKEPDSLGGDVVDEKRIVSLRDLFGDEGITKNFLPSFERDLMVGLDRLRQAIKEGRPSLIHDALHAIQSSATTAGAMQILDQTDKFRADPSIMDFNVFEAFILAAYQRYSRRLSQQILDLPSDMTANRSTTTG